MPRKTSFTLFKLLLAIASLTLMFELLPIDFQHWIAPSLVSYEDVFRAQHSEDGPVAAAGGAVQKCVRR